MPNYLARYVITNSELCNVGILASSSYFRLKDQPSKIYREFEAQNNAEALRIAEIEVEEIQKLQDLEAKLLNLSFPKPTLERLLQIRDVKLKK